MKSSGDGWTEYETKHEIHADPVSVSQLNNVWGKPMSGLVESTISTASCVCEKYAVGPTVQTDCTLYSDERSYCTD